MSRLLHYSAEPLTAVRSVAQGEPSGRYDKPAGLWLSVEGDDDWRQWCEAESFGDPASQLCYEIVLAPDANVFRIETAGALLAFTREYGCDPYMGPMAGRTQMFGRGIQWPRVAEKHAGIIIAPYQWSLRLDPRAHWYYSWDCASGCVWNAEAVAEIRPVEDLNPTAP